MSLAAVSLAPATSAHPPSAADNRLCAQSAAARTGSAAGALPAPAAAAILLLRTSLGLMFLAHSVVLKLLTFGLAGTASFFVAVGLPGWLAYATFAAEALGGALLVLGVQSRWVALALAPVMVGALAFVHATNGWVFTAPNGGWEYPLYLFVLCVAQALLGDGPAALWPSWSPRKAPRPA